MAFNLGLKSRLPQEGEALPGRKEPILTATRHAINGQKLTPPYPDGHGIADFGMGCFWGAERKFWVLPGIFVTAVGYQGGMTPNATYEEICSGRTGHAEVVRVVFDPKAIDYRRLVQVFFESHDPTQGMRQGNDIGTQYRSAIFTHDESQARLAREIRDRYAGILAKAGYGPITTEIAEAAPFYFAEAYHQQYLARNPNGYCGLGGTGEACPIELAGQNAKDAASGL